MQSFRMRAAVPALSRKASAVPRTVGRKGLVVKAFKDSDSAAATSSSTPATASGTPEALKPVLDFFAADNVKLADLTGPITKNDLYKQYVAPYAESSVAKESLGWKALPETINARLAMLGFAAGSLAELLGAGSLLQQFAGAPQPVVITILLITAASIIPIVKATKGDYLESLRDTYSIPQGVFTEANEKVYGRIAMLGFGSLLLIELIIGRALL